MGRESDLIKAVKHNDASKVQKLLLPDKGYNVKRNTTNTWSESPLVSPPDRTKSTGGRIRLELGHIDINCHERNTEYTPLIIATLNGCKTIAETLIFHSADVDGRDIKGNTALHMAVFAGETEFVEMFLQNGASVNCQNNDGNTPLHIACQSDAENNVPIVLRLLNGGADSDKRNKKGVGPLDAAAMFNKKDAVSLLLDHDPRLRLNSMAITEAATRGTKEIVELLLEYGISPNGIDVIKCTAPLHEAVRFLRFEAAKVLLAFGASPALQNTSRETPESIVRELPKAMCDKFLDLFEEYKKSLPRLPRFYGENGNEKATTDVSKDYPLLPSKGKWTKNIPDFCSTCTEKNTNEHVLDDNPYTFWVIPSLHHAWTVFDLQQEHTITGITLYGWHSTQMVKNFELQKSDNIKGPWTTCLSGVCQLLGSADPKEPGVPQTFKGFEVTCQYLRLYIRNNHGGSCICFQGAQLHGVEGKVSSILDNSNIVENKDNIICQEANTYLRLLKMEDEAIKQICGSEDTTELLKTLQNLRENEFPLSTLDWLRVPITLTRAEEQLPDFSVQSDPDVCQTVEAYVDGGKLAGNTRVRLIPSDNDEASIAIFSDISFKTAGSFTIKVRSVANPDLFVEALEVIEVRPAKKSSSEIDAAFDEIQSMLHDLAF
ncbi:uncharacterized protein LOC124252941 [Haliotis rubra]|uniref:uncharacterized protein LOC124252941 n=1 Tax=Haliotis rubra TaxID=36100 RepID=UPI001EE57101|nr:uncharacterized protein LOC124252941 [Haliotis rubra]